MPVLSNFHNLPLTFCTALEVWKALLVNIYTKENERGNSSNSGSILQESRLLICTDSSCTSETIHITLDCTSTLGD